MLLLLTGGEGGRILVSVALSMLIAVEKSGAVSCRGEMDMCRGLSEITSTASGSTVLSVITLQEASRTGGMKFSL